MLSQDEKFRIFLGDDKCKIVSNVSYFVQN